MTAVSDILHLIVCCLSGSGEVLGGQWSSIRRDSTAFGLHVSGEIAYYPDTTLPLQLSAIRNCRLLATQPNDRNTPRVTSSSPSGAMVITAETPKLVLIDAIRAATYSDQSADSADQAVRGVTSSATYP
jgi:hypothetical protein